MIEVNGMSREHETEIKFTSEWGGKIYHDVFSTFRWPDKIYTAGRLYPVILVASLTHRRKELGSHRLLKVEFKRIRDISPGEVIADIGRSSAGSSPRKALLKIMKSWYGKKKAWDGEYSILQKLTLEKLGRGL